MLVFLTGVCLFVCLSVTECRVGVVVAKSDWGGDEKIAHINVPSTSSSSASSSSSSSSSSSLEPTGAFSSPEDSYLFIEVVLVMPGS